MTTDPILEQLAEVLKHERDKQPDISQWEAWCDPSGSPAQDPSHPLAKQDDHARDLCHPLDVRAHERFVDGIVGVLKMPTRPSTNDVDGASEAQVTASNVVSLQSRRKTAWYVTSGALATAACLVLALRSFSSVPALAPYELLITNTDLAQRSEGTDLNGSDRLLISNGSQLGLTLRPSSSIDGPVETRVFAVQGSRVMPLKLQPNPSSTGAIRFDQVVDVSIGFPVGDSVLTILVGRPTVMATAVDALMAAPEAAVGEGEHRWQMLRHPVRYTSEPVE